MVTGLAIGVSLNEKAKKKEKLFSNPKIMKPENLIKFSFK